MSTQSGPPPQGHNEQSGPFHPQGQQAYQTGGTPPNPPVGAPPKTRNTIAIVALVLAVAGAIFGVVEGAYIIGWILLPIAFVLSIVALVVRDKPRKMAVWALVVAIIGSIAAPIAFLSSAVRVIDETLSAGESTVVASPTSESAEAATDGATDPEADAAAEADAGTEEDADAGGEEEPGAADGSRDSPYPLGTAVANDEFEITVNSFTADATEAVMAENQFNDPPADGSVYALINMTVTRVAAEAGSAWELTAAFVTDGGNVITGTESLAVGPDELPMDELYEGGTVTGNALVEIPADATGTVRITAGLFADDVFFATS